MIYSIILILLTLNTLVLLTGNNIGTLRGPYRSLTQLRYASSILILLGVILGAVLEGWKLNKFYTAYTLDIYGVIIVLLSSTILVALGNIYRTPVSLNMSIISGVWGIAVASQTPIDLEYTLILILSWIILPLIGITLSAVISYILVRYRLTRGWGSYSLEKASSLLTSLFLSYVFGANTLGLIFAIVAPNLDIGLENVILPSIILLSYIIGIKYFTARVETGLGYNIYNIGLISLISSQTATFIVLETATQLGIPVSLTQVLTISLLGASLSRELKLINIEYIARMSKVWIGSLILGFLLSASLYLLTTYL